MSWRVEPGIRDHPPRVFKVPQTKSKIGDRVGRLGGASGSVVLLGGWIFSSCDLLGFPYWLPTSSYTLFAEGSTKTKKTGVMNLTVSWVDQSQKVVLSLPFISPLSVMLIMVNNDEARQRTHLHDIPCFCGYLANVHRSTTFEAGLYSRTLPVANLFFTGKRIKSASMLEGLVLFRCRELSLKP